VVAPTTVAELLSPPRAPVVSPFRKVGTLAGDATVFARGPGSAYLAVGIDVVAVVEGDAVTLRPELHQAKDFPLRGVADLVTVAKGTGENVWAAWLLPDRHMGVTVLARFDGRRWHKGTRTQAGYVIRRLFEIAPGRILAIQEAQSFPRETPSIVAVEGPKRGLPQIAKRATKPPPHAPAGANLVFLPTAMVRASDGGTHLVGNGIPENERECCRPVYETFDARGKRVSRGELDVGATDATVPIGIDATSVPGGPLLLTVSQGRGEARRVSFRLLRGGGDKPETVPIEGLSGVLGEVSADAKGNVYLFTRGVTRSLFRVGIDGKMQPLVLPSELSGMSDAVLTALATKEDDVWILAAFSGRVDVYRTKANAPSVDMTLPNPSAALTPSRRRFGLARDEQGPLLSRLEPDTLWP